MGSAHAFRCCAGEDGARSRGDRSGVAQAAPLGAARQARRDRPLLAGRATCRFRKCMTCAMLSAGATRPRCIVPRFTPQRGSFPAGLLVACVFVCLCVSCVVCGGTGRRELTAAYRIIAAWNSALPGNRVPLPHLHWDWPHRCHICTGTGLTPASSASGLGSPLLCPSARGACGLLFVCGQQGAATPAALKRRDLAQTLRGKDKTLEKAFFSDVEVRPPARRHLTPRDTCTASHAVPLAGTAVGPTHLVCFARHAFAACAAEPSRPHAPDPNGCCLR